MDAGRLALLEAGIIRVVTSEEAATMTFSTLLGGGKDALDDPGERFEAGEQALQSWHSRLPRLPIPGVSLCQRCEEIDVALLKSPDGYMHSEDYWRLAASATECPVCTLMIGALRGSFFASDFETAMKLNNPRRTDQNIVLRACNGNGKKSEWTQGDEIRTINVEMTNMQFLPPGRLWVFALPDSAAALRGLQQCLAPYETEKFAILSYWARSPSGTLPPASPAAPELDYPRRLIDVGAGAGNLDADIRLVDKASLPSPNVEYISLSYRWGASNNLKTTNQTLDDHQKGIPMGALPRTLRDAVIVARRLSIRYLWIDSLCIIQDNKADWATEAQHMGDIYMNSAFVIAAHAARHADHGFLEQSLARPKVIPVGGRRDGGKYDAETAAYADFQGKLTDNACKGDQVKPVASDVFFVAESVNLNGHLDTNSALTSRGWVLQERALARKTIHFCTNGAIYLETGSTILSINDHPHHPSLHSGPQELRAALHQFNGGEPTPSPVPASLLTNARKGWYDLVAQYSTRSLTEPRDKLIAISGIARKLQPILDNDNYYCGLWERHMHTNLLWLRRTARLTPSSFSARARAPSWSWAAHDAAVQFPTWSHEGSDDVVRPEIRFGKVLNGELPPSTDSLFDGWGMLELRDAVRIGTGLRFLAPATGKPHWTMGPNAVTMPYQTRFWGVGSDAGGRIGWAAFDWEERDELDGNVDRITCFKVASFSNDRPESGFKRGFLVLFAKLVNPALGIFGRVGMGQIMDASLFDDRDASTRHERLVLV